MERLTTGKLELAPELTQGGILFLFNLSQAEGFWSFSTEAYSDQQMLLSTYCVPGPA